MAKTPEQTRSHWPAMERIVSRFEDALRSGKETAIEDFLDTKEVDRGSLLVELVHVDFEHRLSAGQAARVEQYIQRFPELAGDQATKIELIKTEYKQRRRRENNLSVQEYAKRFPEFAKRLLAGQSNKSKPIALTETQTRALDDSSRQATARKTAVLEPNQTFGKFKILATLGIGGFGTVYRALDTILDREVALKIPHANQLESRELRRFAREARAAAELDHPNICAVYEIGERDDVPYIVMAFIRGKSLAEVLQEGPCYDNLQASQLIYTMAMALESAHQCGVIHRDLKPANVVIKQDNDQPVIMDFGLARRASAGEVELTQRGEMLGTPLYMPPEQARGDNDAMGPACDIYSLGVILYKLLTGHCPFQGSMAEVLSQILYKLPAPPSQSATVHPRLEEICMKALKKDPDDRFQSMQHMADALQQFLADGDSVPAVKIVPRPNKTIQSSRRIWLVAAACAAAAVAILSSVVFFSSFNDDSSSSSSQATKDDPPKKQIASRLSSKQPIDLLNMVDIEKHRILGEWRRTTDGIVVEPQGFSRLVLPTVPKGSYRLHVELTRLSGTNEINLILPVASSTCMLSLGQNPDWWRLQQVDRREWGQSRPNTLINGKRHAVDVRVSVQGNQAAIDAHLDGISMLHWMGSIDALTLRNDWLLHPRSLGLGAHDDRVVFHKAIYTVTSADQDSLKTEADAILKSPAEIMAIKAHSDIVWEVEFSPDGRRALSASMDGSIRVWNLADGKEIARLKQNRQGILTAAFSPDGKYILAGGLDNILVLWKIDDQSAVRTFRGHSAKVWDAVFTPDGQRAISASESGEVFVWDVEQGKVIAELNQHQRAAFRVAVLPDSQRAVSVGADGTARLWDLQQYQQIKVLQSFKGFIWNVAVAADGKFILASNDQHVSQIDTETGKITRRLTGHSAWIRTLAVSADGERCLTGSEDQTIRLWNRTNGKTIQTFPGHRGDVLSIRFSADGQYALSGGQDGTVRLWKLPPVDATNGEKLP